MDNIVYLQALREEKENQLTTFICDHLKAVQTHVDRHVNIREKVKAKHILTKKIWNEKSAVLTLSQELLFKDWFTFDYLTIKGLTNYQTYIKYGNRMKHPLDSVVHALFMASVLEPFKVIKYDKPHIHAKKLLTNEVCTIKLDEGNPDLHEYGWIFLRSIPVFDDLFLISDMFIQHDNKIMDELHKHFEKSTDSWRTFLKKYSIKYSWNCTKVKLSSKE